MFFQSLIEDTDGIINRCMALVKKLGTPEILEVDVGLRPGRNEIRLEKEGKIIHNYGHGGASFTVSWGCTKEVAGII